MRALLFLLLLPGLAHAHKPSDSYLTLEPQAAVTRGQWDVALRDLEYAIGLDANGDGAITWGELRAKRAAIEAYAYSRLSLRANGEACAIEPGDLLFDEHSDGGYAVLRFSAPCTATEVDYRLFFDLDPTHRGLLRLGGTTSVLSPEQPRLALEARAPWRQFVDYAREGVWHIWIGFDHVLFLLSLLLPAVTYAARFKPVLWDVFKVVTAFTVAHSITLALAALAVVQLPSRLVESAIALSVVLAALNNLRPVVTGRRWIVAFAFGLIHGFGFASVLADLGLPQDALLLALVGFNLGVEAGQLAIVATFLPLAFALRGTWAYRRVVLVGGSAAIAAVAAIWLVERAFDLELGLI
ncbi:MAG TPA: HupE/UreJ family protein [Burkholderiales bacterium]|nr:HupE/UreJ family protein [Burkholderiales bacterium]